MSGRDVVPFRTAIRAWATIAVQTFGGPAGQIAVMHRELVEERRWIGERRFLHALSYCTLLPGPEAQQLAIYLGWLLNGGRGGLIAGSLFVLPGFLAILALSLVYVAYGDTSVVEAVFAGVGPAVVAIVASALWRVRQRALTNRALTGIAVAAFVALFVFEVPFPFVIATAALAGYVGGRLRPEWFRDEEADDDELLVPPRTVGRSLAILAGGLALWGAPLVVLALVDADGVFLDEGLFFSGTALVSFGGAYAVLSFVAQRAVEVYGWLTAGEMVRGLAMAETTPGPLIQVVQFVAFLGAYRSPGPFEPWMAGVLASLLVTWVTYVPCFLWIFVGAPYVERLREHVGMSNALAGITAAVVGVIANLAVYFARHALVGPAEVAIAVVAAVLLFRLKLSVLRVLGVAAALGLLGEQVFDIMG